MMNNVIDIRNEFDNISFGDKRINDRFNDAFEKIAENPDKSILQASGGKNAAEPIYQLFNNRRFNMDVVRDEHKKMTVERIIAGGYKVVLAPQDTCGINYSGHKKTEGLGYFTDTTLGINVHSSIALTTEGVPLGLLAQSYITRDCDAPKPEKGSKRKLPIEQKESNRWLLTMEEAEQGLPDDVNVLHICDREGDMYELFEKADIDGRALLSRIVQNRLTTDNIKIMDDINLQLPQGTVAVQIPRNSRGTTNIPTREATLEIKYMKYNLKKPQALVSTKPLKDFVEVTVILAKEINPPTDMEPIEWYLLTNETINNLEDAIEMVRYYSLRWRIETMHKTLKSDACNIEKKQERTVEKQQTLIYLYTIIALRILTITYLSRTEPEMLCDILFTEAEWQLLYRVANKTRDTPINPYTIREAALYLSALAGYKRRNSDNMPGAKVLCQGLELLSELYNNMNYI